jgi:hypothetical protein
VLVHLRENRWRLDALAAALLKYETLDESMVYAAAGLPDPGSAKDHLRRPRSERFPPPHESPHLRCG